LNLPYLIPRFIRHFLAERIVRVLLLRGIIIQAGIETSNPVNAVQRYTDVLADNELSFNDKRVLVFGYGGRFDIGFELLKQGAKYVVLCDKYAPPDEVHNRSAFGGEGKYFSIEQAGLRPRQEWMTLFEGDIRDIHASNMIEPADIVLSSSVYEHVDDVEGITRALARLTKPDGINIHYVDLRDHFFKYPFEMLRFSEKVWRSFLNPSSNHNRYRLWNYRKAFETGFANVEIEILARDGEAFRRIQPYILPQFLSANAAENDVTLIRVIARSPIK
jgi:SAM-dependent methyltransferase